MTHFNKKTILFFFFLLVAGIVNSVNAQKITFMKEKISIKDVTEAVEPEITKQVKAYRDGLKADSAVANLTDFTYKLFISNANEALKKWKDRSPARKNKSAIIQPIEFTEDKEVNYSLYKDYFRFMVSFGIQEFRLGNNMFKIENQVDRNTIKSIAAGWFWTHVNRGSYK